MKRRFTPGHLPWTLAIAAGAATWIVTAVASGKREAWDGALYFAAGLPVLVGACFALGWHFRRQAWRWGVAAIGAQMAIMVASSDELNLFPLGAALFALLMVPCALAGLAGAWLGRRFAGTADDPPRS